MISKEDIENLATLARLQLHTGEVETLQKDISNILGYVGQISAEVVPGSLQDDRGLVHNVMREDTPRAGGDALAAKEESLRAQFPRREGDYNVVRKIIQKDE